MPSLNAYASGPEIEDGESIFPPYTAEATADQGENPFVCSPGNAASPGIAIYCGTSTPARKPVARHAASLDPLNSTTNFFGRENEETQHTLMNAGPPPVSNLDFATRAVFNFVLWCIGSLIRQTAGWLLLPVSIGFALLIFYYGMVVPVGAPVYQSVTSALCNLPVVGPHYCNPSIAGHPTALEPGPSLAIVGANFPALMGMQEKALTELLRIPPATQLSVDVRQSQLATSDLIALVAESKLSNKNAIVDNLRSIELVSKEIATSLASLDSSILGSTADIIAVNQYTHRELSTQQAAENARWTISKWLWYSDAPENELGESFAVAMSTFASELQELLARCVVIQALLDTLDKHLAILQHELVHEYAIVASEKEELLAALWTMVGMGKKNVHDVKGKKTLLGNVNRHRVNARNVVSVTIQTITAIVADLDQLRTRTAKPALLGKKIPLEVQLASIDTGLQALKLTYYAAQEQRVRMLGPISHGTARARALDKK